MSVIFLVIASTLSQVTPGWAAKGVWETAYESEGAGIIRSRVEFDGQNGTYTVLQQLGQLRNIQYVPNFAHPLGRPTSAILATWFLGQKTGYVVFRAPDAGGLLDGYWGYYNPNGTRGPIVGSWDAIMLVVPAKPPPPPPTVPIPEPTKPPQTNVGRADLKLLPRAEMFIGNDDTTVASWLRDGGKLTDSIGRLTLTKNAVLMVEKDGQKVRNELPAGLSLGTCFLIAKGYALTAKHVVEGLEDASALEASFPATQANRFRHFALVDKPLLIEPDIALLRLSAVEGAAWPEKYVNLTGALDAELKLRPLKDRDAAVIHFPSSTAGVQAFNFKNSEFTESDDRYYWYTCDTDRGSSGAPIFNSTWGLVALHWGSDGSSNLGLRTDFVVAKLLEALKSLPNGAEVRRELGIEK